MVYSLSLSFYLSISLSFYLVCLYIFLSIEIERGRISIYKTHKTYNKNRTCWIFFFFHQKKKRQKNDKTDKKTSKTHHTCDTHEATTMRDTMRFDCRYCWKIEGDLSQGKSHRGIEVKIENSKHSEKFPTLTPTGLEIILYRRSI